MPGIQSKIKNRKHICERKNTWRISFQNLRNWSFFYEYDKEIIKVHKNGHEYTEKLLAVEIDEKGQEDRDLIFEEKIQKALEEKLGCELW